MFSSAAAGSSGGKKEKVNVVPCVGVSVGVERVYAILMAKEAEKQRLGKKSARGKETEVYVMSVGNDGLVKERMQICKELWDAGIKVRLFLFFPYARDPI
jgi:histidyl-tRNA synthetase